MNSHHEDLKQPSSTLMPAGPQQIKRSKKNGLVPWYGRLLIVGVMTAAAFALFRLTLMIIVLD